MIILLSIIISITCYIQEESKPEELLEWLPKGEYETIDFNHFNNLHKLLPIPLFDEIMKPHKKGGLVPQNFLTSMEWKLKAKKVKIKLVKRSDIKKENYGSNMLNFHHSGKLMGFESVGETIYVCSIRDLDILIKEGMQTGIFVRADIGIQNKHVYKYQISGGWADKKVVYFIATYDNKLLLTESIDSLKQLNATTAGRDQVEPLEEIIEDLNSLKNGLGQIWSYSTYRPYLRAYLRFARNNDIEKTNSIREELELGRISTVKTTIYENKGKYSKYLTNYYGDDDRAKESYERFKKRVRAKNFPQEQLPVEDFDLDGKIITRITKSSIEDDIRAHKLNTEFLKKMSEKKDQSENKK